MFMGDKETFKRLLLFHSNGCNPEITSRWIFSYLIIFSYLSNFVILDARYFIFLHFYVHIFFLSFLILICGKPAKQLQLSVSPTLNKDYVMLCYVILLAQSWASSRATAEKRARQIQFVNDNVDIKYINGFTTTLIIANCCTSMGYHDKPHVNSQK